MMPSVSKKRLLASAKSIVAAGLATPERADEIGAVAARYAIGITPHLVDLIRPDDPQDPIGRQFVPDGRELLRDPAESDDPIGDDVRSPVKGLVHRYPDRVLIKLVSVCAVYCRFCFRRERIGPGSPSLSKAEFEAALAYVSANRAIWEVILTGGDPLTLSARRIAAVTRSLAAIEHVKVLRWHTRMLVAAPETITQATAEALALDDKTVVVAIHANHPREFTPEARSACRRLADAGVMLVSQSVLLKGVNDDANTLEALMRAFLETRIKPYYLHHPDLAPGTAHWRVTVAQGQALMRELRSRLSGMALPTYVLDLPGGHGKAPIAHNAISAEQNGSYRILDSRGIERLYEDRVTDR